MNKNTDLNMLKYLLLTFCISLCNAWIDDKPRCCSPQTWEATIKGIGAFPKMDPLDNAGEAFLVYNYKHQRWGIEHTYPHDGSKNTKMVHNYKKGYKFFINNKGCYKAPLSGQMYEYCIPSNATYHGEYKYGSKFENLNADIWSYDFHVFPIRSMIKVTQNRCIPLQEVSYGLVANEWGWKEGEPPCNPWGEPEKLAECSQCFKEKEVRRKGAAMTRHTSNAEFVNVFVGSRPEEFFKIPEDCKEVDEWVGDAKLNYLEHYFILRFKEN